MNCSRVINFATGRKGLSAIVKFEDDCHLGKKSGEKEKDTNISKKVLKKGTRNFKVFI